MEQFIVENMWVVVLLALWTLPWTGVALWRSAQRKQKGWFIAMFLINSLALLEILYIFVISKRDRDDQ